MRVPPNHSLFSGFPVETTSYFEPFCGSLFFGKLYMETLGLGMVEPLAVILYSNPVWKSHEARPRPDALHLHCHILPT